MNGRSVFFFNSSCMMKNADFCLKLVSTQRIENLFLCYILILLVFGRILLKSEEKYTIFKVSSLQLCWITISCLYKNRNILPTFRTSQISSVFFDVFYYYRQELFVFVRTHKQLLPNLNITFNYGPTDYQPLFFEIIGAFYIEFCQD